ncbi:MAG TPA: hypothetical protein VF178_16475 [Gemmatimonadaceae bacterium]
MRQFVTRLRQLSPSALGAIEAAATPFDHYYQLALEMAVQATRRLSDACGEDLEAMLAEPFAALDALADQAVARGTPAHSRVRALTKAAARALLVRDLPDFSAGAFVELWAPFRHTIKITELEREARKSLLGGTGENTGGVAAAG